VTAQLSTGVAVLFVRFGPYHAARLEACGRALAAEGAPVLGVEYFRRDRTYDAWEPSADGSSYSRVTLFEERLGEGATHRAAAKRLRSLLDARRPGTVAIPGWLLPESHAALRWCRANGAVSILMSDSAASDCRRFFFKEAVKRFIVRRFAAALVAGTPHRDYAVRLGMPADKVFLGYDVVDNDHFSRGAADARNRPDTRRRLGLPDRYFIASARFIPRKNIAGLLAAYRLYLRESGPDAWSLVILGDGPQRAELERLAAGADLRDRVLMPGLKPYGELPAWYGLAEALIHPSVSEQWGLVVNEAMASGLPALVSIRSGCAADLVRPGINGFPFDPGSARGIADAMIRFSRTPDAARLEMGRASAAAIAEWGPARFADGLRAAAAAGRTALSRRLRK